MDVNKIVFDLFIMMFPSYSDEIISYKYIGDKETIFYMRDNSKVIFDELDKSARYIKPRENMDSELSEEEWKKEFSRKLNRKISLKNITRKELSDKAGISDRTLRRCFHGDSVPDIFTLHKIAKVLECNEAELIYFNYLL